MTTQFNASLYDLDEESSELLRELEEEIILASLPPENVEQSALPRPTKSKIRKKRKHNAIASSSSQMDEGSSANSQEENRLSVNRGRTSGITEIVYGLTEIHLKLPDTVHRFEDIAIHVPHHGSGSRIISKMTFQGTRLFEIDDDSLAEEVHRIAASSSSSSSSSSSASTSSAVILDDSDDNASLTSTEDFRMSYPPPVREKVPLERKPHHRINRAINAVDQLLVPAMSFSDFNRKPTQSTISSKVMKQENSNLDNIESDLLSKFQNLNLYPLTQIKDVLLEGHLILQLNDLNQIEGIHFKVQSVNETIRLDMNNNNISSTASYTTSGSLSSADSLHSPN
eukprot:gene6224-6698_t